MYVFMYVCMYVCMYSIYVYMYVSTILAIRFEVFVCSLCLHVSKIAYSFLFPVIIPSILKKTAPQGNKKKPGQGDNRDIPERGSGFIAQLCRCAIS